MSNGRKIAIVANPVSGLGRGREVAAELYRRLTGPDGPPDIYWTEGSGMGRELTRHALRQGADFIVACGGDGTVQEVASSLAGTEALLGLAPAGRGNDFAQSLGLTDGLDQAVSVINSPVGQWLDLGLVGGKPFVSVAACGFDAEVSRAANNLRLPLTGQPAYLYSVLRTLIAYRPIRVNLTWDEGRFSGRAFMIATANTSSYGGRILIAPQARPDDGRFDVCLVAPVSRRRALRLLPQVVKGEHADLPEVTFIQTRRLKIETERPMEIWADGEPIGRTPTEIEVRPRAIRVALA